MKIFDEFARGVCLASALLTAGNAMADNVCNKMPVTPQSVQTIGGDMIVNGVRTSVRGMQFGSASQDVASAFRYFWIREDVPTKARTDSSGLLLSALDEDCLYVLHIPPQRDIDHTRGLMSVIQFSNERTGHSVRDPAIPLPADSTILSDIESRDPGQSGHTWLLDIAGNAHWNSQRYRNMLVARGWVSVGHQPDFQSDGNIVAQGTAFAMQHGTDSVDVSFSDRSGRTTAVVNATRNR